MYLFSCSLFVIINNIAQCITIVKDYINYFFLGTVGVETPSKYGILYPILNDEKLSHSSHNSQRELFMRRDAPRFVLLFVRTSSQYRQLASDAVKNASIL